MPEVVKKVESKPSFPLLEEAVRERWSKEETYKQTLNKTRFGKEFIFYDGPPFPTGSPHHGTLFVSILKDLIPRYKTMRGYYVPRAWGWDCHGLPIETIAESNLGVKEKKEIESKIGVKSFNDECRRIIQNFNNAWKVYIDKIGRWVDFDTPYSTASLPFMESVLWAFTESYKKGLIYKDYRSTPYCCRCETPLSISETRLDDATRTKQDRSVIAKFRVNTKQDKPLYALAWTTTPWTLPANFALAVGAELEYLIIEHKDEKLLLGKSALKLLQKELGNNFKTTASLTGAELANQNLTYQPLFSYYENISKQAFKIIAADFVSDIEGTGIVHIAPGFGEDDYWLGKKHNLPILAPLTSDGKYLEEINDFSGRSVLEVNSDIIKKLRSENKVFSDGTYEHNYPHCWRCRTPLIYRAIDAWYFDIEKIKENLLANNQQINWRPDTVKNGRFGKWLENARAWNISRNRYWATPIPVWRCNSCEHEEALGSIAEIEKRSGVKIFDLHKEYLDPITYSCSKCLKGTMRRVLEVLDCWFESGSMPYGQWHYPFENKEHFENHFPADFIVEYASQIRGWFYLLHVLSTAIFDKPAFKNCMVHGTLLAADGKKLSKSLKNYTDPLELIDRYGADALRAYLLGSNAVLMDDLLFKDEGVEGSLKNLILPYWNALAFFTSYAEIDKITLNELQFDLDYKKLNELDRFILSEIQLLVIKTTDNLENYAPHLAMQEFPKFFDTLNNWYIRRSRSRVWSSDPRAPEKMAFYKTLYYILKKLSLLIAPFCPFIAEIVWERLGEKQSVHLLDWPEVNKDFIDNKLSAEINIVREVVSAGLAIRAREKIRVRQPLSEARLAINTSMDILKYEDLIKEELNIKKLSLYKDGSEIGKLIVKANSKLLGPKYGSKTQAIITALKNGEWQKLADGNIAVCGENLSPEEFEISYAAHQGGESVEATNNLIIALSTTISEALKTEGLARDLVRHIQDFRKEVSLEISDRIRLNITGADEVVKSFRDFIANETLAVELSANKEKSLKHRKECELEEQKIEIALEAV
ncbi:MAG TPA: isoleucine--tRNA ligase [Oligoflexia bacterium]|nr:isoleucine--tRNA ligase [Oligoflexia bacterium]HMP26798.1 isoleucine--tRNA ligase [Oligoflexia bacterium]